MITDQHQPVLLSQAIDGLAITPDGIYVDGTFGRGGHARALLSKLSQNGQLLVTDKDPAAVLFAKQILGEDARVSIKQDSFAHLINWVRSKSLLGKVNGILLDLGMSSPQVDEASRGFSFLRDGPLDMRMDTTQGMDAATWINQAAEKDLAHILKTYGEERFARRIARKIVLERQQTKITTTGQLAKIIERAVPRGKRKEKRKHPATRSFLAIRIFINNELDELKSFLENSLEILAPKGRLVVISFHSLEDRIVKQFMRRHARGDDFPVRLPVKQADLKPRLKIIHRKVLPDEQAIKQNPRARSAVLRVVEKL